MAMAEANIPSIRVAVVGSAGARRNYICHAILGDEVLKENNDILQTTSFNDELNEFFIDISSIAITEPCTTKEVYKEELQDIAKKSFDLLLYCISVTSPRPCIKPEKETYEVLRQILPLSAWSNCIVVLTNADSIVGKGKTRDEGEKKIVNFYKRDVAEWTGLVRQLFDNPNLQVIPAGGQKFFSILDDGNSWLSELFLAVTNDNNSNLCKLLCKNNLHRFTENASKITNEDLISVKIHEHPIIVKESSKKLKKTIKEIIVGVVGGSTAGAIGATVGSLIGALAIGIPSFGIFAGLGLLIGGVIGGGTGVVTGVSITKGIERAKSNREPDYGLI